MALLDVENLSVWYRGPAGPIQAVREISISVASGEALALVGETGSGKSTVALALMGLLDGSARVQASAIRFMDKDLGSADHRAWEQVRGRAIGMVFQDARGALNPVLTIGAQLKAALRAHRRLSASETHAGTAALLAEVGIPDPAFFMHRYPIELSGGMCQRVAIALAICNEPSLLIADEPTSALDPSIQAQVLELLRRMRARYGLSMLLISHDLALVADASERVAVMYHGRLVESGSVSEVLRNPAHPYTSALIACQADLDHHPGWRPLAAIAGAPPASGQTLAGCAFAPRCAKADADCLKAVPGPKEIGDGHWAACIR